MNALKFRFWSKREKQFTRTVTSGAGHHDYYIHISDLGGLIGVNHDGIQDPVIDLCEDDFIAQPYTTYRDKNLREIYVGDIVKGKLPEDGTELIAPVSFSPQFGYFVDSRLNTYHEIVYDWCLHIGKDVEVIGNIFETPELLNNQDL